MNYTAQSCSISEWNLIEVGNAVSVGLLHGVDGGVLGLTLTVSVPLAMAQNGPVPGREWELNADLLVMSWFPLLLREMMWLGLFTDQ